MASKYFVLASLFCMLAAPAWGQVNGRMVVTSPDGTREVEVSPGQAIYVTCPDGTCAGGGGVAAAVDLTKIGGVAIGGADVVDVPNTAFRVNCVVGCSSSSFTDNSAFTFGTTAINITGFVFDDVAPNAATENRAAAPRMSGNRVPYSILRDAAGNERGANVNASNELTVSLGDIIGVEFDVTNHPKSLQIGGTIGPANEWHAAWVTSTSPSASANGLVVRDATILPAMSSNGGGLPSGAIGVVAYSRSDSAMHIFEARDSKPLGTEFALLTRPIFDTQISQLHNTIANPTRSIQIGGANTDGGTHRHVGASNADPSANDVGLFTRNISGMGTPGSAAPGIQHVIAGRDPVSNAVRQIEVFTSRPAAGYGGLITRPFVTTDGTNDTPTMDADARRGFMEISRWMGSTAPTVGQKTMANSLPVVIASDQTAVAISSATLATEATLSTVNTHLTSTALVSTTALLGISGVYTSAWFNVIEAGRLFVTSFSDVSGAVGALTIQWSGDGVNVDTFDPYNTVASTGKAVQLNPRAPFVRIQYTNGVIAQGVFRLYASVGRTPTALSDTEIRSTPVAVSFAAPSVSSISLINGKAPDFGPGSRTTSTLRTLTAGGPTNTSTTVMATDMDTVLLASNTSRMKWAICNTSRSPMFVKFGSGATTFSYSMRIESKKCYEDNSYTGQINAVWDFGADQFATVNEVQ